MSVGIGIVGSGFMGRTWANVAAGTEGAHLVGVAGGRRAPALADDLGCRLFADVEDLLRSADADLVILTSPPAVHADQAVAATANGKAVLVEKPMAPTVDECMQMAEAAEAAGTALAVVSQHRFRAAPRAAEKLVRAGEIGSITMVRAIGPAVGWWDVEKTEDAWKLDPLQQTAFASWGAHACDLLRWLLDDEPDLAFALFAQYSDVPPPGRSAMATYRFRGGAMAQLWMSYDIPRPGLGSGLQLFLVGTDGMLDVDCYGDVRLGKGDEWATVYRQPQFDASDPNDPFRLEAYAGELRDVLGAMASGSRPLVDGREGIATTAMLEAAEQSARLARAVEVRCS